MIIKVGKLNIRFETETEEFCRFLREEYGLIECAETGNADITVRIVNGGIPEEAIKLKATRRECGLLMNSSLDEFTLFVPYKPRKREAFMLVNPTFMPKWQACLADFLHNAFLAALEVKLLENGMTLFHASAVRSGCEAKLLLGTGGAGKSTIAGLLAKRGYRAIAEDFCVIGEGNVYPLPHRARVSLRKYDTLKKRSVSDSVNRGIVRVLGRKPYRVLSYDEIYSGSADASSRPIGGVYLLDREGGPALETMDTDETAGIAEGIMLKEFGNMAMSGELFDRSRFSGEALGAAIRRTVGEALAGIFTARLLLPKYEDLNETAERAEGLLLGENMK